MEFNIDQFLKEKIEGAKKMAANFLLSKEDAEDVSQEIAAEFFIKFNQNRIDMTQNIDGYWHLIQSWRILDKQRRNAARDRRFLQIGDENNMDSFPFEREASTIKRYGGILKRAVLNLKKNQGFGRLFKRDLDVLLLSLSGKSAEEITKIKNLKNKSTVFVSKCRMLKTLKESVKNLKNDGI